MKILALLVLALPLCAQPKATEVFGSIGYGAAQGDEGSDGRGAVYGGAVQAPFARRWAFDLSVHHVRTSREAFDWLKFGTLRTYVSPGIVYRRGNERLYWFVGGGAGLRFETTYTKEYDNRYTHSTTNWNFHCRTGLVAALTPRLLLRAEVFAAEAYLVPDSGAQIGLGYRF